MITFGRKLTLFVIAVGIALAAGNTFQPSLALTNGGSITAVETPLTEQFDSLANTGTGLGWTDNVTIPGLYSSRLTYNAGDGSSNTGALYSFGVAGANPVTDRALGSVGSGGTGTVYWGVKLTNNSGGAIASIDISYAGEQWRNGGGTGLQQTVDFQYKVANAGATTGINAPTTGWVDHDALDFASPIFSTTAATLDGNAPANRVLKSSTISVSVASGQEIWLRWRDIDHASNDHGLAIDDFSVTAHAAPPDVPPTVSSTTPANGATGVAVNASITINFSENVSVTASAFTLQCPSGTPRTFTQSATPSSVTLTPTANLPNGKNCTVTIVGSQVTDLDGPADPVAGNPFFTFRTIAAPVAGANVIINEIDADTPGSDTLEFVELFDGGAGNTPLDGLVVVFYTGPDANTPANEVDKSYTAFELDGYRTNAAGYFTLGNPDVVPAVNLPFLPGEFGLLQNGPDAVALYVGDDSDFPFATPLHTMDLQDAIVYGTDDADDPVLMTLLTVVSRASTRTPEEAGRRSRTCAAKTAAAARAIRRPIVRAFRRPALRTRRVAPHHRARSSSASSTAAAATATAPSMKRRIAMTMSSCTTGAARP